MSRKACMFSTLILAMLLLSGCSSVYLTEQPRVFNSCANEGKEEKKKSFDAIVEIITNKNGWFIDSVDLNTMTVKAQVCRRKVRIPLQITVNDSAGVEFIIDPDRPKDVSRRWGNQLKLWLDQLEGIYSRKRCGLKQTETEIEVETETENDQ